MTLKDPERPTLDVIDAVLSGIGYPSGWLQEALRGGDRSLVYVVHAFPSSGIDGGHFGIITQTTMANYEKVVEIILEKLEKIKQKPLDSEELAAAKDMIITMHEMSLETNGGQARSAALNEVLGLGYDWDARYPELVEQVSAEDVFAVAQRLFEHQKSRWRQLSLLNKGRECMHSKGEVRFRIADCGMMWDVGCGIKYITPDSRLLSPYSSLLLSCQRLWSVID
jgi:predicted Zn-dependent peptidase